jgi:hypothetical protein
MNPTMQKNDEARPELDELLHDYFQAQIPQPWPTFKAPLSLRQNRTASFWSRSAGRMALAACIALMVAGYLTLGGFFPTMQAPPGATKEANDIGMKEPKRATPTPHPPEDPMEPVGNLTTHKK